MTLRDHTAAHVAWFGALYGFACWTVFAAIEYLLWSIWPHFVSVYCGAGPLVWDEPLNRLVLYPVTGVAAGAVAGFLARTLLPARFALETHLVLRIAASLTLLAGVAAGVFLQFEPRGVGAALLVLTATLGAVLTIGLFVPLWGRATRALTGVWLIGAVPLAVARLGAQGEFGEPKVFVYRCLGVYLGLVAVALVFTWFRSRRAAARPHHPSAAHLWLRPSIFAAAVVAVGLLLDRGAFFMASRPAPEAARPDVILIVLDTVRADHLSVYGYARDTTPNLKTFAQGATTYSLAVAASNHTLPSHASLFTGLYPASHGAHPLARRDRTQAAAESLALGRRFETLAERLAVRGYLTAGVAANYAFVSSGYNLDQGFDQFATLFSRCAPPSPGPLFRHVSIPGLPSAPGPETEYYRSPEINRDVIASIDRLAAHSNPFFQFVNYMDAHWPYAPPPPYDQRFPGKDAGFAESSYLQLRDSVLKEHREITEREKQHLISQYDGSLAFLDEQLGRLFDHLRSIGRYDSSLIVITSDHGEAFGDRDLIEHGTSLYQDQIHIPLLIKYPGQKAGVVVRAPVSHVDILPTVLDVAGMPVVDDVRGVSLRRLKATTSRPVISESYPRPYFQSLSERFHRVDRAYLEGRYKLLTSTADPPELYNLTTDPSETQDLYATDPVVAKKLVAAFDKVMATLAVTTGEAPTMDSETIERLKSLGYLK